MESSRRLPFTDVQISNCTFYASGGTAIMADSASYRILVENNMFVNGGAKPVLGGGANIDGTVLPEQPLLREHEWQRLSEHV